MAKFEKHKKALELRLQGKSYSQIKKVIGVSKSTLSLWLRNYPLSDKQMRLLRDWNETRIEKYRETRRKTKEKRLEAVYNEQRKLVLPLDKRDLFIGGLFLYWGEGTKHRWTELAIANTDPSMIKFFLKWLHYLKVPKEKIRVRLQLYKDMDIRKAIKYWSEALKIPRSQFRKPYIKSTLRSSINYKGAFGHGTCNILIGNARLTEKIMMSIKNIADSYK